MSAKYFRSELAYLREMGREFAEANPGTAAMLSERSSDPDVERLLEGVAFMSARVRERIDDAVPELAHGMAEMLVPHAIRTVPSTSVIVFTADKKKLRGLRHIPAGTSVESVPVDGAACKFQTAFDVTLAPLWVIEGQIDNSAGHQPSLRLSFLSGDESGEVLSELKSLRLYINDDPWIAATLLLWFSDHVRSVKLKGQKGELVLEHDALRIVGLEDDEGVLPWPGRAPTPYRLLTEFLVLPQKFQFVDLKLPAGADLSTLGEKFELVVEFERPPVLPGPLNRSAFRLHCTSVVNLFDAPLEPIRVDELVNEYELRPLRMDRKHFEVLSASDLRLAVAGQGERVELVDFYDFHRTASTQQSTFALRRSASITDAGVDVHCTLQLDRVGSDELARATLSGQLQCTNRSLPTKLQVGDICVAPRGSSLPEFSNIAPVSPPIRPPLGEQLQWRLLSHISLTRLRAADADTLKALMALYNFPAEDDIPAKRANEVKIDSIMASKTSAVTRLISGAPVRGSQTRLTLDEARFTGVGEAFLFGCVIDRLLGGHASVNEFHELIIVLHPSERQIGFAPRNGEHRVL